MKGLLPVFKRELSGYFTTPVALVFIVIFLFLAGVFTFNLGAYFERGQADMVVFFNFHPWLYLFLIPAVSMRLWAEERKSGTIELLLTLPISLSAAVVGKFLAAWAFAGIALALTFPLWITTNYLGSPDNGVILAGYLGSLLMAGAFLAIGSCISASTKSQVIAFIISVVICVLFMLAGIREVQGFLADWLPVQAVQVLGGFSFLTRFEAISRGVLDARDVLFFASIIGVFVAATGVVVNMKKAV
ncbi:MAG: ABC transporter permease subunit [Phycisphaerales bacterium]|nr:ABC transporter permease subunit [Phycisphaerales bacterium]